MLNFWLTFLNHAVLLVFLLPLIGAVFVLAVSRADKASIQMTALSNVSVTCVLAVLMILNYDAGRSTRSGKPELIQMVSRFDWFGSAAGIEKELTRSSEQRTPVATQTVPEIRLVVGVDGISLWLIAATPLLTFIAIIAGWSRELERPALYFAMMLVLEACVIGALAALDIVMFCFLLQASLIPLFVLVAEAGGYRRREAAKKLLVYQLGGSLLIMMGLISAAMAFSWMQATESHPNPALTFSVARLTHGIPLLANNVDMSNQYWNQVRQWIFLALVAGFAIKLPLPPFHYWLRRANLEAVPGTAVMLIATSALLGGYGFLRFVLPMFPMICKASSEIAVTLISLGVVYSALSALGGNDRELITAAGIAHLGLCIMGMLTLDPLGVAGGLLHLFSTCLSLGLLLCVAGQQREDGPTFLLAIGNNSKRPLLLWLAVFSLMGVPALNGFSGQITILAAAFLISPLAALMNLTALMVLAWACIQWATYSEAGDSGRSRRVAPLGRFETGTMLAVVAILFAIGVMPDFFRERMQPTINDVLSTGAMIPLE